MRHSLKFKEKMVEKMTGPRSRSANELSTEVGIAQGTLSRWLREAKMPPMSKKKKASGASRRGRGRWSPEDKVRVVMEAAALSEEALGAFLRREGLHETDLTHFRAEVEKAATEGLQVKKRRKGLSPEEKELRALRKELARKNKALAETAALLVLRGKVQAFLTADEEGDTDESSER